MPSPNIFVCAYFKEGAYHADREIHDPSSCDESSKTNSTIKSSGGRDIRDTDSYKSDDFFLNPICILYSRLYCLSYDVKLNCLYK